MPHTPRLRVGEASGFFWHQVQPTCIDRKKRDPGTTVMAQLPRFYWRDQKEERPPKAGSMCPHSVEGVSGRYLEMYPLPQCGQIAEWLIVDHLATHSLHL